MKILEFHFNPKAQEDSFVKFLTEESLPSRLGNLYVVGELQHTLPHQASFLKTELENLRRFFAEAPKEPKDQELQAAVRSVNAELRSEIKKGNVSWLGNLHIAALNLRVNRKGQHILHLAKAGTMKVLIAREGRTRDIDQETKTPHESSGVKMFSNTISGQVMPGDKIFCVTGRLFEALEKERLLSDLSFFESEKQLQKLFEAKKKELSGVAGLLIGLMIEEAKPQPPTKKKGKKKTMPAFHLPVLSVEKFQGLRLPVVKSPRFSTHWRVGLVALLVLLLGIGFLLFKGEREKQLLEASNVLERVVSLQTQAENTQELKRKNQLLQEAWRLASPRAKTGRPKSSEFKALLSELEPSLSELNFTKKVSLGEPLVVLSNQKAKRMLLTDTHLVLYTPFSAQMTFLDLATNKTETVTAPRSVRAGTSLNDSPVFVADPGVLMKRSKDGGWQEVPIRTPYERANFADMDAFADNLYLFDPEAKEIIRYSDPDFSAGSLTPSIWLESSTQRKPGSTVSGASLAVDGNVWVLTDGKEVHRYFSGVFRETLEPLVFPFLEGITSISSSSQLPNLYLSDPSRKRIVVLTKFGELQIQYVLEGVEGIDDMVPSSDGSRIYLLSSSRVFSFPATLTQP